MRALLLLCFQFSVFSLLCVHSNGAETFFLFCVSPSATLMMFVFWRNLFLVPCGVLPFVERLFALYLLVLTVTHVPSFCFLSRSSTTVRLTSNSQ